MKRAPQKVHPSGWFQVAWSFEIQPEEVRPLFYFGQELVSYRGKSGEVHIFDAFCPHMGAHLGYGGSVHGDDIVCPFHGWRWGCDGRNVDIPYSENTNRSQKMRSWPVREANGIVWMWHDAAGAEPSWEPPVLEEFEDEEHFYLPTDDSRKVWSGLEIYPQFVVENFVDAAHLQFVHGASQPGRVEKYETDGHVFKVILDSGGFEDRTRLHLEAWGVGIGVQRIRDHREFPQTAHFQVTTPVDDERSDLRATMVVRRPRGEEGRTELSDRTKLAPAALFFGLEQDFPIWRHMKYVQRAPLAAEEAKAYSTFRKWAEQFYPRSHASSAEPTSDKRSMTGVVSD